MERRKKEQQTKRGKKNRQADGSSDEEAKERDRLRKKPRMEDQMQNHVVSATKNPVLDGGARIQKLKTNSNVSVFLSSVSTLTDICF